MNRKLSYPNEDFKFPKKPHDINKWMSIAKQIYSSSNKSHSLNNLTKDWNSSEKQDFINWLKFYEQGNHLKYKFAQNYYGSPGYFLPLGKEEENSSKKSDEEEQIGISPEDKQELIRNFKKKIISRLDSIDRVLDKHNDLNINEDELSIIWDTVHALKVKIRNLKIASLRSRMYEDLIIREANILQHKGFVKSASLLRSVAQNLPTPPTQPVTNDPSKMTGNMNTLPASLPGQQPPNNTSNMQPQADLSSLPTPEPQKSENATSSGDGIKDFLENMATGNITVTEDKDENTVDDDMSEIEVFDDSLISEAQLAPEKKPTPPTTPTLKPSPEITDQHSSLEENKFDKAIDNVLSNVTVEDVVQKLEDLSKIFKTREIPRQLSLVDMMLDSLGLAPFFSALSEASNKSLESNNYILTRIEDVLSKLRGAIKTNDIDLRGKQEVSPSVSNIKENLQNVEDKEKLKKDQKKEEELSQVQEKGKEEPSVELPEQPAAPKPPAPTPAPPAPKPI